MHNLICSTPVNWNALGAHLNQFGKEIAVVKGDDYCFRSSVTKALARDCGKLYSVNLWVIKFLITCTNIPSIMPAFMKMVVHGPC